MDAEEIHDGSARIEKWDDELKAWRWCCTCHGMDDARQQIGALRASLLDASFRFSPPGTKGYHLDGQRIEDGDPCILKHCGGETYCGYCGKRWDYGDYDGTCDAATIREHALNAIADIDAALTHG